VRGRGGGAVGARVDLVARHDAQRAAGQQLGPGTVGDDSREAPTTS
jgi:hypothetical protein